MESLESLEGLEDLRRASMGTRIRLGLARVSSAAGVLLEVGASWAEVEEPKDVVVMGLSMASGHWMWMWEAWLGRGPANLQKSFRPQNLLRWKFRCSFLLTFSFGTWVQCF